MEIWLDVIVNGISSLDFADWANVATIAGIPIAALVLIYTAYQVYLNTNISRGQFWLELEKMFSIHDEVHIKLRPGGEWAIKDSGPETVQDWAKVEDYMGLFEHCELMLRRRLIDWETFKLIFSYRIYNIVSNKIIVDAKLRRERKSWQAFIRLLDRLKIEIPE
jgi:hypothetical protein